MIQNPSRAVKDLDLLSENGKYQLAEWHKRPQTNEVVSVVDAIKQHALQQPAHPAICAWDGNLTYAEFDNVTSRLAHYLRSLGIGENSLVLVGFEKTVNAIIAVVSILKAGAAFVPVSPHYPTARMQIIADITQSPLSMTSPQFATVFERVGVPSLELTQSFIAGLPELDQLQEDLPATDMERCAYVMFTSGSTGRPKGVVHAHRSLSALVNQAPAFEMYPSSRVLQFAPSIFAASLMDLILPLILGATMCIASQHDLMNNLEAAMNCFQIPAPVGSIGEILFYGENVSRGYLNDPEKTVAMYIEPPGWVLHSSPDPIPRLMLRTGDLARYAEDGSIVYIGRKDMQVKIRGKRVELGEVESTIRPHLAPDETVITEAISPSGMEGTTILICFIYAASNPGDQVISCSPFAPPTRSFQTETARLDVLVRATLPDFMVPSIYIPLAQIPKTPSGKTDRLALKKHAAGMAWQELEVYVRANDEPRVQPQTDIQRLLHTLFCENLNRDPDYLGINEAFIKLGGDSIQAIRLVQMCRSAGFSLTVQDILEHGTIAELAELVKKVPDQASWKPMNEDIPTSAVLEQMNELGFPTDDVEAVHLCSPMQEGILMSQLKTPDQHALRVLYEAQSAKNGATVYVKRLKSAWKHLTQRHPMLRSIFVTNLKPQVFAAQVQLKNEATPHIYNLEEGLEPSSVAKKHQNTQLSSSLLPQLSIHIASDGRVFVEIELSHAVTDGLSMSIIVRDFCALYNEQQLSPLNFNHAEYMNYKRQTVNDSALSYWKEYLGGMDSCQFPTANSDGPQSRPSENRDSHEFKSVMVDIGPAATYHKFARDTGTTLSNVVKLAWCLVLRTVTRMDDICFGYLISGRDAPIDGVMDAVGPLIDLMICRQRFEPSSTVLSILCSIQSDFGTGLAHRGASFADIRRALNFGRDEIMFNTCITQYPLFTNADGDEYDMALSEVSRHDPNEFDLGLEVMISEDDISTRLKAYTSVVPAAQMKRIGALLGHIMNAIVTGFDRIIDDLELISEDDRSMIKNLNKSVPNSVDQCAHEIIQAQCQAQPSAPAVDAWDGKWTYKEFDELSTTISQYLTLQGVASDTFVPVLMDKSRWVPISLLAILKAGAAFVLLEPSQPMQRLQEICNDLRSTVIISSQIYRQTANSLAPNVVLLDNQSPIPSANSLDGEHTVTVGPRNLAYAVFTSGSTGKPKGVMIEHRSLCTTGASMRRHSPMNSDMRMSQYASFAFDVSVLDLIVCFMAGGCLCIPSFEDRQNRLLESLNDFKANYVALTPTVTRTLQPERLTSLKTLKVSGEALSAFDIQRWGGVPGIQFINMYGPAECTINVTVQAPVTLGSPPHAIGHSMSNSTAWVVDPNNHESLCPVGVVGELVIQGPVVARGYLNRPEQTAAAFIPPPRWLSQFMQVPSEEKLYKTGDLVQYAIDGTLLYKGRKDSQVKLRGQRLELGEVEEHLRRVFPNATEVIAEVASLNQGRTKALAAFIYQTNWDHGLSASPRDDEPSQELLHPVCDAFSNAVSQAKLDLAALLPSYMEPSIYLPLARIPQTRSGKTDRGQLRKVLSTGLHEQWASSFQTRPARKEPSNEAESVLCRSVAVTLTMEEQDVSMDDNFFRRGGDSVAAMTLVSLLREQNYHVTVADIFQHSRLDSLAQVMHCDLPLGVSDIPKPFALLSDSPESRQLVIKQATEQCVVPQDDIEDIYPCSPLQHAFFLFSARKKGTLVAQFAYNLRPTIDLELLRKAWHTTTLAHPQLRTRIISVDGKDEMHQVVLRGGVEIEYYEPPTEDVSDYMPDLPIDVQTGKPLLRIAFVRRPSSYQHRLVVSLQHSMYDGWSLAVLMQELERAYSGAALKHLPTSSFIRHIDQTKGAAKHFWTEELKDLRAPIFPAVPSSNYTPHPSATLVRKVPIPQRAAGQITLSTKVRWAWAQVISLYTGSLEVAFGLGTAGRGTPVAGIERMMTPTLGIFPYRLYIDPEETVIEALRKAQQNYVKILPHEHYGNPDISRLATGPTSAVALQTLLIVQPQPPEQPSSLYSEQELLPQTGAFHVLPEQEMLRVISLFDAVFQQICGEPEMLVQDLKGLPG
ncbi:Nonribosomal Peptide Synthase (NRPS) [Aspergillus melleus]|uniref:Nonribosomal Peptide Synthase (NRPS) n=1 Tax=Aspergillus melleus TaxID=138277 RepID=A0ACC3BC79_9EURO|nr:Nonribosomal Peptide Synthase (NRPS) [Aspergillus melleus]